MVCGCSTYECNELKKDSHRVKGGKDHTASEPVASCMPHRQRVEAKQSHSSGLIRMQFHFTNHDGNRRDLREGGWENNRAPATRDHAKYECVHRTNGPLLPNAACF